MYANLYMKMRASVSVEQYCTSTATDNNNNDTNRDSNNKVIGDDYSDNGHLLI